MKYRALAVLVLAALVVSAADAQRSPLTADSKVESTRSPRSQKTCPDQQQPQPQRKRRGEFQRLYPEVRMVASAF